MKHIDFNQSTVMREYAKIAVKKGFIKKAEDVDPAETKKWINEVADRLKKKSPMGGVERVFYDMAIKFVIDLDPKNPIADIKNYLFGKLIPGEPKEIKSLPDKVQKDFIESVEPKAVSVPITASDKQEVKTAESKLYDISGETGKELVEKAHPGGGTRTELTHSKTDENLVETIVEQQDKDIGVAMSIPKGTYAALMNLYNVLSKKGLEEHLGGLKEAIESVASPNEELNYKLEKLCEKLEQGEFKVAAEKIKDVIKKAIDQEPPLLPVSEESVHYEPLKKKQ